MGTEVERVTHKKQKSKQSENLKKRNFEAVEEEDRTSQSKREKLNGKKRLIMELEDTEVNSSNRKKSAGQDGCKQLGCSTHKGIS